MRKKLRSGFHNAIEKHFPGVMTPIECITLWYVVIRLLDGRTEVSSTNTRLAQAFGERFVDFDAYGIRDLSIRVNYISDEPIFAAMTVNHYDVPRNFCRHIRGKISQHIPKKSLDQLWYATRRCAKQFHRNPISTLACPEYRRAFFTSGIDLAQLKILDVRVTVERKNNDFHFHAISVLSKKNIDEKFENVMRHFGVDDISIIYALWCYIENTAREKVRDICEHKLMRCTLNSQTDPQLRQLLSHYGIIPIDAESVDSIMFINVTVTTRGVVKFINMPHNC